MNDLRKRVLDEFINLVKIDSLSLEEERVFDYILQRVKDKNLEISLRKYFIEEIGKGSANLIIKIPANSAKAKSIFFDAHVDTVEPGRGIEPVIEDDRIKSSGNTILAADDKSAVASMLVAIDEIIRENFLHGDLFFLFTSAEEIGLMGIKNLDISDIKADFGFVLDSHGSVGRIITKAPFHYKYNIRVVGKAAHAGIEPEKGINAIKIASKIVSKLPQGRINRNTVANVGTIDGGKATNIIPDECIITGEFRSHMMENIERLKKMVEELVARNKKFAVDIELDIKELYKGFCFKKSDEIIKFAIRAIKEIGLTPVLEETCGGSNTNIYNENGIYSINLSTGMQNLHSTEEYIEISEMEKLTRLILTLAKNTVEE